MNDTIEVTIVTADQLQREQLIAQMALIEFDGFEENEDELKAFIEASKFVPGELLSVLTNFNLGYSLKVIPEQNWNAIWESNFSPVVVESFCAVRADFHPSVAEVEHEIIITPKMSFGTGHHA